jgi:Zn-finger nucleic acid-binding protein
LRLVACRSCHTQYDVTEVADRRFACRCGAVVENRPPAAGDARVHRCSACGAPVGAKAADCEYCGASIVRDSRRLSLICPECYGRNAERARFCTACGVAFRPEAVRAEGYELPCPACGGLMPPRQVAGLGVNECPSCNGIWAAADRFELLVARAMEARRAAGPGRLQALLPRVRGGNPLSQRVQYRKCPECDAFMQRRNFRKTSGVVVDVCREHGTWLDADELERIAGYILSGGRPGAERMLAEERPSLVHHDRPAARMGGWQADIAGWGEAGLGGSLLRALSNLFD